jgi:hypothetical protein
MEIEIVEFYETFRDEEKHTLKGTLHIYLVDLQLDLRGLQVLVEKKFWRINIPHQRGKDPDTGEIVQYPVFAFMDREKTRQLIDLMRKKGREFIMKKVGAPFFKGENI